jgi:hypothetical protein
VASLRSLGAACFALDADGQALLPDPFVSRVSFRRMMVGRIRSDPALVARYVKRAHYVLVSHAHFDHMLDAHEVMRLTGESAYGSANVCRLLAAALGFAGWLDAHLEMAPNGWFPRRSRPDGSAYRLTPEGREDPFFATSADGLYILDLWAGLTAAGLADYREPLRRLAVLYVGAGGFFGSINHGTYDPSECVGYAVAFRTFRRLGRLLNDASLTAFAYRGALPALRQFEMREDRNGVPTRGLLWMERTWDTAYLWENAEAAEAYLEAYDDRRRPYDRAKALAIVGAMSRHRRGPHGFLTEGVD